MGGIARTYREAAIAIGSNLGERRAHLDFAIARLRQLLGNLRTSTVFETDPVDVPSTQPPYLNAAVVGSTALSPRELVSALLAIEEERGRERPGPKAARTLDLDLILLGDCVIDEPAARVPHPRFRERRFVLEPLAEIGGAMPDPVTHLTVQELLDRAPRR